MGRGRSFFPSVVRHGEIRYHTHRTYYYPPYLLTSATSSSTTALDEEFVPQFREFGLESTKVIISGLVLLS